MSSPVSGGSVGTRGAAPVVLPYLHVEVLILQSAHPILSEKNASSSQSGGQRTSHLSHFTYYIRICIDKSLIDCLARAFQRPFCAVSEMYHLFTAILIALHPIRAIPSSHTAQRHAMPTPRLRDRADHADKSIKASRDDDRDDHPFCG
jgi:hypothetical protein